MLLLPVVFDTKALNPTAMLLVPVVLAFKALVPTLVLLLIALPPKPILTPLITASTLKVLVPAIV